MAAESQPLPVLQVLAQLLDALATRGAAVLVAPPGTGKTTGVPPALAQQPWAAQGRIVVVEPRRLAARVAANRMAGDAGGSVGDHVGYAVRGERRSGPLTRIEVVTEGLFLRRLQADPTLEGVAAVVLDEFHERSLDLDMALALLCDVRSSVREDLRLVVMSATIDPVPVAALLGDGEPVPVVTAEAPMFPVATRYRPGSLHDPIEQRVAAVVAEALRTDPGDVLVFLPGRPEIRRTAKELGRLGVGGASVLELHGSLSPAEQEAVVQPGADGRRVILSTSLAETSITVPGVRVVVDSGRRRTVRVDAQTGLPQLTTGPVSRAGADQRRGRAGRTAAGVAYRLWAESDERHRPAADTPEILDGDLAPLLLQLLAWGVSSPEALRWLDAPPQDAMERARTLLVQLGAVDTRDDGRAALTAPGREMADIGFHPRLAAIARQGRRLGCTSLAAEVLAVLETSRSGEVDLTERVRLLRAGDAEGDVRNSLRLWRRSLRVQGPDARTQQLDDTISRLLLAGFADRVARRRGGTRTDERGRPLAVFHLRTGTEVAVRDDGHPLAAERWLVVADLDAGTEAGPGRLHLGAAATEEVVLDVVGAAVEQLERIEWDLRRHDVVAERRSRLGAIQLGAEPLRRPDRRAVVAALVEGVRADGLDLLERLDRAAELRGRVGWLHATRPDDGWPDWSEHGLLASLDQWLVPRLGSARRRVDLARVDVRAALADQLDWQQRRVLDELAPTSWTTASGRRVPLRYGEVDGEPATVMASVRLRDVLGTDVHPTVGPGRLPVVLELLSPAGRPVQRTTDLPGFWRGSYAAVRSDMRGRYPKHPWPERPWEPQSGRG